MDNILWGVLDIVVAMTATLSCTWAQTSTADFSGAQKCVYIAEEIHGWNFLYWLSYALGYPKIPMTATLSCTLAPTAAPKVPMSPADKISRRDTWMIFSVLDLWAIGYPKILMTATLPCTEAQTAAPKAQMSPADKISRRDTWMIFFLLDLWGIGYPTILMTAISSSTLAQTWVPKVLYVPTWSNQSKGYMDDFMCVWT